MCDRVKTTTSGVRAELTALDIVVGVVPHTGFPLNQDTGFLSRISDHWWASQSLVDVRVDAVARRAQRR